MKRTLVLAIAIFSLALMLVACGAAEEKGPEGTAAEIADKIFAEAGADPFGMSQEIATDQDKEWLLGSAEYPEFADSVAVMPMISLDTRVLHVIKAANSSEVDELISTLEANIDPTRLICVTFSLEDVVIDSRGDVVFMTINSDHEQRDALAEAFQLIN
jgi:hypothetical protein